MSQQVGRTSHRWNGTGINHHVNLEVSPDSRTVIYKVYAQVDADLMMIEHFR